MDRSRLQRAHEHSRGNRRSIAADTLCGCFHCLNTFDGLAVAKWVDDGQTALCPVCGVDAVLTSVEDDVSSAFLLAMHEEWFGRTALTPVEVLALPQGDGRPTP